MPCNPHHHLHRHDRETRESSHSIPRRPSTHMHGTRTHKARTHKARTHKARSHPLAHAKQRTRTHTLAHAKQRTRWPWKVPQKTGEVLYQSDNLVPLT
jgi:hypothetical protein